MPFDDPRSLNLTALFHDAAMFDSRKSWRSAGFQVIERANNGKIMVARHPSVRGLLFKKYTDDVSRDDQRGNYERRIQGAERLRAFFDDHRLIRVAVPRKWLVELPRPFSRKSAEYVLVVEQLDLLSDDQTKTAYQRIDPAQLVELCTVLYRFRGLDSIAKNMPFASDGRICFVDTEHWDRETSKSHLHRVGEYLSSSRRALAKRIFKRLDDGDDVRATDLAGDFDDEEDTSSSDFDDEEDTSSSSSS